MKRKSHLLLLLFGAVLMSFSALLLTSCDDDEEIIIFPKEHGVEINAFFDSNTKDFFRSFAEGKDICFIINDRSELEKLYKGNNQLPQIDFETSTLIIGKTHLSSTGYQVDKQFIKSLDGVNTLTLQLHAEGLYPAFSDLYYWGIYPKLTFNKLEVKINYNK